MSSGPLFFNMRVKSLTKHVYAGLERSPGEQYEMEDQDVNIMCLAGHVVAVEIKHMDVLPTEPKKYRRRDMKVE